MSRVTPVAVLTCWIRLFRAPAPLWLQTIEELRHLPEVRWAKAGLLAVLVFNGARVSLKAVTEKVLMFSVIGPTLAATGAYLAWESYRTRAAWKAAAGTSRWP